ncbi:MAG: glycosyltransferase family 39 protein [Candidatus Moranbacteria bacterium]|nr:glycosyltransferase family 39 protein [Candidatus Moranbacteria bacterium]
MEIIKKFISQKPSYRPIAMVSIVLFALVAVALSLYRSFNHDEFEAIHSGWKIFAGEKIYVDFLQQHHFMLYYVLSDLIAIVGEGVKAIIASRLLSLAMAVGVAGLVYRIAKIAYDKNVALLSVFFLSSTVIFLQKILEVRPDVPLVLFELLAVFFLLRFFETKKLWQLLLSATALFVSFLFLQKAVFLIFLIGLIFLYKLWKKEIAWKDFLIFWGMMAVFSGIFIWYVAVTFTWSEYFFLNWLINANLLNTFPLYKYLLISMEQNPLVWILFVVGIVELVRRKSFSVIAFLALGMLSFIFATKSPFPQYYLTSMPFIVMVAAAQFVKLFEWKKQVAIFLMLATVAGSLGVLGYVSENNKKQLQKIDYVLSITNKNDRIYDGDANFNVFRKDLDYFWFSTKPKTGVLTSYRLMREYDYNAYTLIDKFKPKVISNSFIKIKNPAVADNYAKSPAYSDLYIRK